MVFQGKEVEIVSEKKVYGKHVAEIKILSTGEVRSVLFSQLSFENKLPTEAEIAFKATAAKINSEVFKESILAAIESNIIPLPHQILTLEKVVAGRSFRALLADEVGMGKTIEAGLIHKEVKLRGIVKRTLIVAPKSAMGQWQQEMKRHFNESFQIYDADYINTTSRTFSRGELDDEVNIFTQHDQIIVSMDALKPIEGRQGWTKQQVDKYNRSRIQNVLEAEFDLLVIDECHKVGGSTSGISRFQMADELCKAIPNVLLLSATPHRGNSGHFRRILQLLDADAFAGEGTPSIAELEPYVVRTEKRQAIDFNGRPLFHKRQTKKIEVLYDNVTHKKQKELYKAITEYVVTGFNLAHQTKNTSYENVMILFQRMMSSSTAAISDALQERANKLSGKRKAFNKETILHNQQEFRREGQNELDLEEMIFSMVEEAHANYDKELAILKGLIRDAKDCMDKETDAKADFLFKKLEEFKSEEGNDRLKIIIFTEFRSTQCMLKRVLEEKGGYLCQVINGSMTLDQRMGALKQFKETAQILISTDAAGESLNMQFAHIVINYDIPWDPMVLEQRIGRVDRIGQSCPVTALNIMLDNSVDKRVYEVVETKLSQIMNDLGIDKTSDVLDSTLESDQVKKLYLTSLLDPAKFEEKSSNFLDEITCKLKEYKSTEDSLPTLSSENFKANKAEVMKHGLFPQWLETLTKKYLQSKGITYENCLDGIKFKFPGFKESIYTFNSKKSLDNPVTEPLFLQHEIIQTILKDATPHTGSRQVPKVKLKQKVYRSGLWSLWHLEVKNQFDSRDVIQPMFISTANKSVPAFAEKFWNQLVLKDNILDTVADLSLEESKELFNKSYQTAEKLMQPTFEEFETSIIQNTETIRSKTENSFAFKEKRLNKIRIENFRKLALKKLYKDKENFRNTFLSAEHIVPSLTCLVMIRIANE
jgi:superfamily II DNA or RNA helicase